MQEVHFALSRGVFFPPALIRLFAALYALFSNPLMKGNPTRQVNLRISTIIKVAGFRNVLVKTPQCFARQIR